MTVLWLIVWLIHDEPDLHVSPRLNNWLIALIICVVLDVIGAISKSRSG